LKTAILVAVGDELLSGIRRESNCSFLAWLLHDAGWKVTRMEVIPDDLPQIIGVLDRWIGKTDILVLSGGLGPTHDDKTRYALAEYLGCALNLDDALYDSVSARYEGNSVREYVERSRPIQGLVPEKAAGVYNPAGSALGIYFEKNGTKVWSFPGVPSEYKAMVRQELTPLLSSLPAARAWS
jgi:nicotinamide-nucleotide amidase